MPQWTEGDSVVQGTQLHYYRTGGAKPALVLLHGITDDGLCWTPVAQALEPRYDVVMVDLRGHGKSEAPEEGYTLATVAAEVAGLITALGLKKPGLIGHSLGALSVLTLAGQFPDLPQAIVLEDPPPFWNAPPDPPRDSSMLDWMTGLKRKTRAELLAEVRATQPQWAEAELEPWVDSKLRFNLQVARLIHPPTANPANFTALLRQITCPALLLGAEAQRGAITTSADLAKLKEALPHLQVTCIPGAGHNIRRDQFDRFMEAVQAFLNTRQR